MTADKHDDRAQDDDQAEAVPEPTEHDTVPPSDSTPTGPGRSGAPAWAVALTALVGLGLGVAITYVLTDDDDEQASVVDCEEAIEVVNSAVDRIDEINESDVQDAAFFAALIVEQRTVSFAMEAAPTCFSLADRAGAAGLVAGLEGLLASGVSAQAPPPVEAPSDVAPTDDADVTPEESGSDEGG